MRAPTPTPSIPWRLTVAASAMAGLTLLTSCGSDDASASGRTGGASSSAPSAPSTSTPPAESLVVAWLQDPEQGMELTAAMAQCEATRVARALPEDFLRRVLADGYEATAEETDRFVTAVGEAEQGCVQEMPDDPAAP